MVEGLSAGADRRGEANVEQERCCYTTNGENDKGTQPHHAAGEGEGKGNKVDGHKGEEWEDEEARCPDEFIMVTGFIGLRDFFKRKV